MIIVQQMRAARALLGWKQTDLADASGVGIATIRRIEAAAGQVTGAAATLWKLQAALENAGIEFIAPDGTKGPGVRLKRDVDLAL